MRAAVLLALVGGAAAFTTTLHGGADEATPVGTPGAATLLLQPWLTNYDPDVRPLSLFLPSECHSSAIQRVLRTFRGVRGEGCGRIA